MEFVTKILMSEFVTHDTKRLVVEKPKGYKFVPGQATEVSINKSEWKKETRPFTFTSLNEDNVLEFTIKEYPQHKGVTEQLHKLRPGDEIIIREPWGAINYKGPGVFIAGGAGITPFIAILRHLHKENKMNENVLIFSNKTAADVILEKELRDMLKGNLILTLTREQKDGYKFGRIDENFLKSKIKNFKQKVYICGPPKFVKNIKNIVKKLGAKADSIVIEE